MRRVRRVGGLASVVAVIAGLAAGCGPGTPSATPSQSAAPSSAPSTASPSATTETVPSSTLPPSPTPSSPSWATSRPPTAQPTQRSSSTSSSTAQPTTLPAALRGKDFERIPTSRKVVALTFDGGSSDAAVPSILQTLRRENVPATFFVTGDFARRYPASVSRIVAAGHRVGNHSDRHLEYPTLTNAQIKMDLARAETAISSASGKQAKPLFRFPYGARTTADIAVVNDVGYVPVRWTVDTLGWKGTSGGITAATVRDRVLDAARPGEIVLMHVGANPDDGTTLDADALPGVIEQLRSSGYEFVTLDALLG